MEVGPMRIRFDGKTVVVSGAGHGFGRCIAETFAQLGARVFGCDLSAAELAETAKAGVKTQVLDLTDRGAAAAWIAQIEQTTGDAVDVLDDNAGDVAEQEMHPIEQVPDTDWDRVLRGQHRWRLRVEPCNGGGHEASR
jgi:3-oxoacyl-[acyl-carrier protein] reductase